ncbi:repressor-RNA polymerase III Maf1 [Schizosaccharomyces cryophilus OY26]|uniref:Repressor of RNA polymerase III transcription MAF1 n=1 Tax=Schizosaccharomyces cryophilus (strain OY26 / ATCC MYA-4695 / CBS 11777 / NBRC 106824 / NRRL Y48691) TaxID=653667 RepID=S9W5Y5_SCHCR|nr:repressor-RNA polymerase III Maf1 [Schizosaccharomyces cryophilus OY26]EPY53315.1 repressor-RNA polymerase III Maf1 [Schizosaccharomyces cryophilus OY26]
MKFLELADLDAINNALSFDADDCRIHGKCEIYTTKSTGSDKKLYKAIETRCQEDMLAFSSSKSPELAFSLTQQSPFGPLDQSSSRRTFMYIVATLNASHPDHDFSNLQPTDFYKEPSLSRVLDSVNATINGMGRGRISVNKLWETLDRHINLSECNVYSYTPDSDSDPYGDEALIWSMSYFFFNKNMKRMLYFSLHGLGKEGTYRNQYANEDESVLTPVPEDGEPSDFDDDWVANMDE